MTKFQKITLFLLRVAMGWLMLYAGITKLMSPGWWEGYAQQYIKGAQNFHILFQTFLNPSVSTYIKLLNEWGLTLLGVSLILGIFVRLSAPLGALLMLAYYLPLPFPANAAAHSYVVDDHIIYLIVLLYFAAINAGKVWGLDAYIFGRSS